MANDKGFVRVGVAGVEDDGGGVAWGDGHQALVGAGLADVPVGGEDEALGRAEVAAPELGGIGSGLR